MAQPSWVTGSGSLGTIPEGKFYRSSLEAYDPDFPADSTKVKYIRVAGALPSGIQLNSNGTMEGMPTASLQGIPADVSKNITSKFSIRVFTEKVVNGAIVLDRLSDRTFTITVTGQDAPEFVTPAGELGKYTNGELVNKQIVFTDNDPSDTAVISVVDGSLPAGVTLSSTGLLYGYITPASLITDATIGWENEPWDSNPLQFNSGSTSKSYQFTLRITDGTDYNIRTFSIYVGASTADSTAYTVDSGLVTADTIANAPYIKNYSSALGTFLHNNYFVHKFNGTDHDNNTLNYSVTGTLPTGLSLDTTTGYLHGTLANIGLTQLEFNFTIKVYQLENTVSSTSFDYSITIVGDINTGVTWTSPTNLGMIDNGDISVLNVNAVATAGTALLYRLKTTGVYNKLPQGLTLQSTGNIVGRVAFQTFGLFDRNPTADASTTTDSTLITGDTNGNNNITLDNNTTTFDQKFTFTVEAYSTNGQISTFKTFSVSVNKKFTVPLCELVIDTLMPASSRTLLGTLLQNQDVIKQELLFRADDPYFGVSTDVTYSHAYGLSAEPLVTYINSLKFNHYNKRLVLGNVKTAQALDETGNVQYEVVYSEVIDNIKTVSNSVSTEAGTVYPNSLSNMQDQVISEVGQVSTRLPTWMLSKQTDGSVLGFVPAWIIAYTLPGQSSTLAYSINAHFKTQFNKLDFVADRYILKGQFAENWDAEDQQWLPTDSTTFDIYEHAYSVDSTTITSDNSASGYYTSTALVTDITNGAVFDREISAHGVKIVVAGAVGGQIAVPDEWASKIAQSFKLFIDKTGTGIDATSQENFIKTLRGDTGTWHAGVPTAQRIGYGGGSSYTPNWLLDAGAAHYDGYVDFLDSHMVNDMVWYQNSTGTPGTGDEDAQEVIEHVFHTMHMHGLDVENLEMYPEISSGYLTGPSFLAMKEAVDAGVFDPSGYAPNWETDADEFTLGIKEYLYLLNFSMFEYTALWSGGSLAPEWSDSMRTQAGILSNNPLGYALFNTYIAPIIAKPSLATIRSIFQDGDVGDPMVAGLSGYVVSNDATGSTLDASSFDNTSTETIFDKKSCVFVGVRANKADISTKTADTIDITADNGLSGAITTYQVTDKYDTYLMFPNKDIINIK
mgnify:CR=1 FL=1